MTISGYSNAFVDLMLGWLKGLANWVLRLFNLAGSASGSPLLWLSRNWLKLLVFFLVLGIVLDRLIWLIRWRPYWVWFRKERVIVNDDRFFVNADIDKASDWEGDLASNWDEHDYVVASTVVKRQQPSEGGKRSKTGDRSPGKGSGASTRRRSGDTRVKRHVNRPNGEGQEKTAAARAERGNAQRKKEPQKPDDNIFTTELGKRDVSDSYEDEVFNVSNLPAFDEYKRNRQSRNKSRRRR